MWRDDLIPASYNDVPFSVRGHDASGGRRQTVHEFPYRDRPQIEDMGAKSTELSLDAILVGDDYMLRRDRLLHELQRGTIGRLMHPWRGLIHVGVSSWHLAESHDEGGMCKISLTFIDGDAISAGAVTPVTADRVVARADALKIIATRELATSAAPSSPSALVERVAQLDVFASTLTAQVAQLQGWADSTLVAPIATVLRSAQTIRADLARLVALPAVLATTLSDLAAGIFALFTDDAEAGFKAGIAWARATGDDVQVWQSIAGLAYAAQALTHRTFDSSSAATAARDQWLALIDEVQLSASDTAYEALIDLRSAVVADVAARAVRLPMLSTLTLDATLPALVVAHQVYGDATRAADLVRRNNVRHPGFVPGGCVLEVLNG